MLIYLSNYQLQQIFHFVDSFQCLTVQYNYHQDGGRRKDSWMQLFLKSVVILHYSKDLFTFWIVHQKMKTVIYSPSCCSKPTRVSFFCWTQNKIFRGILETKHLLVATDFQCMETNIMEVNGYQQPVWLLTFFKLSYFVFNRRQKLTQVWNNMRVSKWQQKKKFLSL